MGPLHSILIGSRKPPGTGKSTGGDIINRIAIGVLEFGDFSIVNISTDKK
jgi:hypothetical protein